METWCLSSLPVAAMVRCQCVLQRMGTILTLTCTSREIADVPYYIDKHQSEYLKHMQVLVDVMEGQGASFSLESAEGYAFLMKSKVMK